MVMRASATPQVQSGTMHAALTMDKCVTTGRAFEPVVVQHCLPRAGTSAPAVQCNICWQAQPTAVALWILHGALCLADSLGALCTRNKTCNFAVSFASCVVSFASCAGSGPNL